MLYVPYFNHKLYFDCASESKVGADLLLCHKYPEVAYSVGLRFAKIPLV